MTVVRVAVHGTHLRVTRKGTQVTVDLTEGVVSIGTPPRAGSTVGTLVTAPAHVVFDAADLAKTLRVDHDVSAVRAAVALVVSASGEGASGASDRRGPDREGSQPRPGAAPRSPATVARPTKAVPGAEGTTAAAGTGEVAVDGEPALPSREAIARAVRACAAKVERPGDVHVTVTSTLRITVGAKGEVERAQFEPPLLPEIQTCAAVEIYRSTFAPLPPSTSHDGFVTIPITFSY